MRLWNRHVRLLAVLPALGLLAGAPARAQSTGTTGKPSTETPVQRYLNRLPKDARHYDGLCDSLFHDVGNVVQLGMDFALTFQKQIDGEFLEWAAGHPLTEEQQEYQEALATLNKAWKLLLEASTVYTEMRKRPTDDETTRALREESRRLYLEGVKLWKEAKAQRKAADEKRAARQQAEREKVDAQNAEARRGYDEAVERLKAEATLLDVEEAKENAYHELQDGLAKSDPNPQRSELRVRREAERHRNRLDEIDRSRDGLGAKFAKILQPQYRPYPAPKSETADQREAGRQREIDRLDQERRPEIDWKSAPIPPAARVAERPAGATLAEEKRLYQKEKAAHQRLVEDELDRHQRNLGRIEGSIEKQAQALLDEQLRHGMRSSALDERLRAIEERHQRYVLRLTAPRPLRR